jgi:hypothetical protein
LLLAIIQGDIMQRYGNLGGDSGVRAFEISSDSITVEFSDGAVYLYNYSSAGTANIEQMKQLALSGSGLNSYINRNVRKAYAARLR